MNAVARDVGRAQRQAEAERRRVERESIQAIRVHERELQRSSAAAEKEARQRYLEDRIAETEELNRQMEERLSDLSALVEDTLRKNDAIDFETLRIREPFPGFSPPADVAAGPPDPEKEDYLASVKPPGFLGRLLPGAADEYREACAIAEEEFNRAIEQHRSLSANVDETPNPWQFSVEGETGNEDVHDHGRGAGGVGDRGTGEGTAATVHGR
jgi:exonuclease VII large subunit